MNDVLVDYEGTQMTLSGLDISPNGMGLWGPKNCPSGAFEVSVDLDDSLDPLRAMARVVRQFHSDGGAVWGIRFEELDTVAQRRLAGFIQRQAAAA